jgi:hypothetical protein
MGFFGSILKGLGFGDEKNDEKSRTAIRFSEVDYTWNSLQSRRAHIYNISAALAMAEEEQKPSEVQKQIAVELLNENAYFIPDLMDFATKSYHLALEGQKSIEELERLKKIRYTEPAPRPDGTGENARRKEETVEFAHPPTISPQIPASQPVPSEQPPTAPTPAPVLYEQPLPTRQEMETKPMPEPKNLEEWKKQNPDAKPWKLAQMTRKFKSR